jgi:hypothetical protein
MTTKRYTWPGLVSTPVDSVKTNNVAPTERRPPRPDYAAPTPNVPPLPAPREPATVFDLLEWAAQCATTADDAATVRRCGQELRARQEDREKYQRMLEHKAMVKRKEQEREARAERYALFLRQTKASLDMTTMFRGLMGEIVD